LFRQATYDEPLLFELGAEGRTGDLLSISQSDKRSITLPKDMVRQSLSLPNVSQVEIVRHFTKLSQMNWGVDIGPYPLGSCTMKYNPKIDEDYGNHSLVQQLHPDQGEETLQGALELMWNLEGMLCGLTGMDKYTLQPAAGAQGELTGCLIMKRHHDLTGKNRDEIIVPDSAHGTNPASAAMAGFKVVVVRTRDDGMTDLEMLKGVVGKRTVGLMMTNPNTLGIYEAGAREIAGIVHDAGGLMYYDGANLQGMMGWSRPGDLGFDIVHLNLHKTFSTPHGGGGPGAGPVGVKRELVGLLPVPTVGSKGGSYFFEWGTSKSIGRMRGGYCSFPVLVRAYIYLLSMGWEGLRLSCGISVLNTNYFAKKISGIKGFSIPFGESARKHEVVVSANVMREETGVGAIDVAKGLLDAGLHPPTVHFPLIVKEALMFEFTDTETKENIDRYVKALREISALAYSNPRVLKTAPHNTSVGRLDEVRANHPKTLCLSQMMLNRLAKKREETAGK
jgi:glycine dehydrogenase subunit 2